MSKMSINNIQAPAQPQQPNALQQMGQQATPVAPQVSAPMQATAASASPMKSLVPQSLTSLTSPQAPASNALGQMSQSNKALSTPSQQKSASTNILSAAASSPTAPAPVQGVQTARVTGPSNLPANNATMAGQANSILPGTTNTALADFSKNVGGQYAGTPWSNALQESLNQYSQVWEQTKQQLSQQYRDNNLSAATNAASSGFSPFGAASADLNRQAATNNYNALNQATTQYGTGLTNIMGQYGTNAFNAQATDVNNQNAMQRIALGNQGQLDLENQQAAHAQDRLNQEIASQPKAPVSTEQQAQINDLLKNGRYTNTFNPNGDAVINNNSAFSDDPNKSITMPKSIFDNIRQSISNDYSSVDTSVSGAMGKAAIRYYAAYNTSVGHPPTAQEVVTYLNTLGYRNR